MNFYLGDFSAVFSLCICSWPFSPLSSFGFLLYFLPNFYTFHLIRSPNTRGTYKTSNFSKLVVRKLYISPSIPYSISKTLNKCLDDGHGVNGIILFDLAFRRFRVGFFFPFTQK